MTLLMLGEKMTDTEINYNFALQPGQDFSNHNSGLTDDSQRAYMRNTSDFVCENSSDFLVVQIPTPQEYPQRGFESEIPPSPRTEEFTHNVTIQIEKDDTHNLAPSEPHNLVPPEPHNLMPPEPHSHESNFFVNELIPIETSEQRDEERARTESFSHDAATGEITNVPGSNHEFNHVSDSSEQIIQFQGDLRDYTHDKRSLSPQRSFEPDVPTKQESTSNNDLTELEELEEGPGSLYDALIQPYYSTRYRLKSLAMAVSRSLPSSPRFRAGQRSPRHSQSAIVDFGSKSHRFKDRKDESRKQDTDAEDLLVTIDSSFSTENEDRQEERPKSTSPVRQRTSQISMSSVRSVKTVVTKSTSIVDVSNGLSTSPTLQRAMPSNSHLGNNLPRSTSTPGLASSYGTSNVNRGPNRLSTGGSLRELGGQPWSLSRAESLAEGNGFQHCIVCRACSSRAKQIRPGRHFVLSWKQIIAMIFALSVYIAGGTLLFIQLEYSAETKRQDNFIRFFKGFVANHSCVKPNELLEVADTLLKDPNLAILMLREISANYEFVHQQATTQFPDFSKEGKQTSVTFGPELDNSYFDAPSEGLVELQNNSRCLKHLNGSVEEGNSTNSSHGCNVWTSTARIWDVPNSLGFVISALTTIGYGLIVPRTMAGRLTCVAYGVVGIPLMLLFLGGIGEQMRRMTSRFIMRKRIFPCGKRFNQALNCSLLGMVGIMLLFMIPSIAFVYMEGWTVADAIYYCFISLSTIGFGDIMLGDPTSRSMANKSAGHQVYRLISLVWVLFGLAYVGMCITSLAHLIIRGSCGANNVETMRLKTELKRLKHEIRAQRMYTRRSGLSMWTSQMPSDREGPARWDFDFIAEDGDGQKY